MHKVHDHALLFASVEVHDGFVAGRENRFVLECIDEHELEVGIALLGDFLGSLLHLHVDRGVQVEEAHLRGPQLSTVLEVSHTFVHPGVTGRCGPDMGAHSPVDRT